jgi:hypothetical protein
MPSDRNNAVLIAASIVFAALVIVAGLFYLHYAR